MKIKYLALTLPFLTSLAVANPLDNVPNNANCYYFFDNKLSQKYECAVESSYRQDTATLLVGVGQDVSMIHDYSAVFEYNGAYARQGSPMYVMDDEPAEFYYRDPNDFAINYNTKYKRPNDLACYKSKSQEVCYEEDYIEVYSKEDDDIFHP